MKLRGVVVAVCLLVVPISYSQTYVDLSETVAIDPSRGADPTVDYAALVYYGPWDDRNYDLTAKDLEILTANEATMGAMLPAYFKVGARLAIPALGRDNVARYPLSSYNAFRQQHGGYRIDGKHYRKATRKHGRFYVDLTVEMPQGDPGTGEEGSSGAETDFVSGEVRVTSPNGASESAIAINPANTNQVIAGTNGPSGGQRMHYSTDGGETWTQVNLPLGGTCCDPGVDWSSNGQFGYTVTLGTCGFFGGCELWLYRTDDGGQTWTSFETDTPGDPRREIAGGADREYIHVDKHPASPFVDNIYVLWHEGNVIRIATSSDLGNTFNTFVFGSGSDDRGIAGDATTDKNGHIYYAYPAFNSRTIRLRKSTDGGATFQPTVVVANTNASFTYPLPSMESRDVAVYVALDTDRTNGPFANSIYMVWPDPHQPENDSDPAANHSQIHVAYSRDGGSTWNESIPHATADVLTVDRFQPFLNVGPDGTVHVVFYDTRRSVDRTATDLFYTFSTDGAVTWAEPQRVTSEMSPNIADGFEYGDYLGMDLVMNDLIAIFTDNRSEGGGGGDSIDVYAVGITPGGTGGGNTAGRIPGGQGFVGIPLTVQKSGSDVALDWEAACSGDDYGVYEGQIGDINTAAPVQCTTGGATDATVTPAAGNRFFLIVPSVTGAEGSYGRDSAGAERPVSTSACEPQSLQACP